MIQILASLLGVLGIVWLGSIEYRLRNLNTRLIDVPNREEVGRLISTSNKPLEVQIEALRVDINRLIVSVEKLHNK